MVLSLPLSDWKLERAPASRRLGRPRAPKVAPPAGRAGALAQPANRFAVKAQAGAVVADAAFLPGTDLAAIALTRTHARARISVRRCWFNWQYYRCTSVKITHVR